MPSSITYISDPDPVTLTDACKGSEDNNDDDNNKNNKNNIMVYWEFLLGPKMKDSHWYMKVLDYVRLCR